MATIKIRGDSPGAPSPATLTLWDEGFKNLGATRTGSDDEATTYDDPNNSITRDQAMGIVGDGWSVNVITLD